MAETQCTLNACEVFDMLTESHNRGEQQSTSGPCTADIHWRQLDRRLRAIEQSTWTISFGQSRWRQCAKSPCRCDATRRSLNCWRAGLTALTTDHVVPADLLTISNDRWRVPIQDYAPPVAYQRQQGLTFN